MFGEEKKPRTETEIIRDAVNRAAECCAKVRVEGSYNEGLLHQLATALYAIRDANERRDRNRELTLSVVTAPVPANEDTCRALLEIGCDVGIDMGIAVKIEQATDRLKTFQMPENPFRRTSTRVEHMPTKALRCDCPRAAEGEHFNECSDDRPWKRSTVRHEPSCERDGNCDCANAPKPACLFIVEHSADQTPKYCGKPRAEHYPGGITHVFCEVPTHTNTEKRS